MPGFYLLPVAELSKSRSSPPSPHHRAPCPITPLGKSSACPQSFSLPASAAIWTRDVVPQQHVFHTCVVIPLEASERGMPRGCSHSITEAHKYQACPIYRAMQTRKELLLTPAPFILQTLRLWNMLLLPARCLEVCFVHCLLLEPTSPQAPVSGRMSLCSAQLRKTLESILSDELVWKVLGKQGKNTVEEMRSFASSLAVSSPGAAHGAGGCVCAAL